MKILKFYKTDCKSCQQVDKLLKKLSVEYENINAYDNPEIASKYRVRTVPTVIVINRNKTLRITGYNPEMIKQIVGK